ncbi:MAG: hypothetical protein AAFY60_05565, partial [Myxococcota bacterium]
MIHRQLITRVSRIQNALVFALSITTTAVGCDSARISTDSDLPGPSANTGGETATCADGVRNQDESGIDCGGECAPCETHEEPGDPAPSPGDDTPAKDPDDDGDDADSPAGEVAVFYSSDDPAVDFAAREDLRNALEARGYTVTLSPLAARSSAQSERQVVLGTRSEIGGELGSSLSLSPEAYAIRFNEESGRRRYTVLGGDSVGAMYGGLALAERIAFDSGFEFGPIEEDGSPHFEKRGQKMNIPLDARATSYADAGDAPWAATQDVWDVNFWEEHFDEMARHRYNLITFWAPNPFASMVDVDGYTVALDDQPQRWNWDCLQDWRSRDKDGDEIGVYRDLGDEYSGRGLNGYSGPKEHGCQTEDVPTNGAGIAGIQGQIDTIEEKELFWQHVMNYADQRGIDVYFITWNVI